MNIFFVILGVIGSFIVLIIFDIVDVTSVINVVVITVADVGDLVVGNAVDDVVTADTAVMGVARGGYCWY